MSAESHFDKADREMPMMADATEPEQLISAQFATFMNNEAATQPQSPLAQSC
jgi:hypothetical protein